jgi:Potential Queuosine, Q, salvage protein family
MGDQRAPTLESSTGLASLDWERLFTTAELIQSHSELLSKSPETWSDPHFFNVEASRQERCQFFAIGNAINFRFWMMNDGRVNPSVGSIGGAHFRGALYMWRRLRVALQTNEFSLDAQFLAQIDEEVFNLAFMDENGSNPLAPGIDDRIHNLRQFGTTLLTDWGGQFMNMLDGCEGSLSHFVKRSSAFRAYDDPIHKLTMLNAIMLTGAGLVHFDEEPSVAVDYHIVKQALRQGIVVLSRELESKVAGGDLLTPTESIAIRASVAQAMNLLTQTAGLSGAVLDNLYWSNRSICTEETPVCGLCPFAASCAQRTWMGQPREMTRYY